MANYKHNWMIATHKDESKLRDLYRFSYSKNFFERILPRPAEFLNDTNEETARYERELKVSDRLNLWRKENWGTSEWPTYELNDVRKLSKHGTYFTTYFAMRSVPPIKIYKELHRQGFRVKAYYINPGFYCGSYIYGVEEFIDCYEGNQDIPEDIEWAFDIDYLVNRGFDSSSVDEKELNDKEGGAKQCKVIESEEDINNYFLGTSDSSQ